MNAQVDFFYSSYGNFRGQVLTAVREETFGRDIGQNSWLTADEFDRFIDWLHITARSHVLEVASGSGGPAIYLARRCGCEVTGVDINAAGVAVAGNLVTSLGSAPRVRFRMADANSTLPFAENSFDALLCIDSMNHFTHRLQTLKEWRRVLKPGCRAVFTDPVVVTGPVTGEELALRSSIGTFVFAPAPTNEELIMKAGFRIVSQLDATENAALVSRRWREARERFRDDLMRIEGRDQFAGIQDFLGAVHRLSSERRLSRIAYLVEK